ncbi:LysR family transcriptional regulator [Staphylococcus gallinarum]|uniref:LysR family transcriptional regulator n=1 Tax=Staphylococcus gallinarum TaxID=1293 RepID=UPI001E2972EF|nr:LysR family transcriptional regulator [Staphylococcus gallinarum]MCD8909453.1 LysR family transcriptional regulator [Staphylococcus gallinarum]MCD8919972.1 LysR family transcriptional regulator [Staphylococcus gallinarum]UEH00250.1 LysR family transcriptional regulator [Staphylococcus gallinarum]
MTLQRYVIFNKVVQLKTMSEAAELLFITQPGLSNSIKSLEEDLNLKLLNRTRSGVSLTPEGERIYKYTLQLEKIQKALIEEAQNLNGFETGIVNVGSFSSITANWLPNIVKTLEHRYPGIEVNIHEGDYESLEKKVLLGELDCCFNTPSNDSQLNFIPFIKDELICMVSEHHPLSNSKIVSLEDISMHPFIKPKKNWDDEIRILFEKSNLKPNVRYEVSEDGPIIALVEANLGINIRPKLVLEKHKCSKKIKLLKLEEQAYRILGMYISHSPTHATNIFIDICKELYADPNMSNSAVTY